MSKHGLFLLPAVVLRLTARRTAMRVLALTVLLAALVVSPLPARAESLTVNGATLVDIVVDAANANIVRSIDLGGDVPLASYVMAHMPDGKSLQRTNLGYWIPWDGRTESLIDNGFVAGSGTLIFKVLRQDISDRFFPITIVLAYRTASNVKFGVFQVSPQ